VGGAHTPSGNSEVPSTETALTVTGELHSLWVWHIPSLLAKTGHSNVSYLMRLQNDINIVLEIELQAGRPGQ
jgi:hypothetical protein